ncbi:glycosylphosphatidylinositol anchored membrane protein boudin isoform X2 [Ptiloglossa arizonensis]|uniref:glycosylphosphatidylinositol anchored membrane protein boudin isoform X2 n=1 Tax=Ptiloglossa arizonensis TaxID=3350558 RepID=UPI003FA1355D
MGANNSIKGHALFAVLLLFVETVHSLECYQCISTNNSHPFQCNEFLSSDIDIEPQPCDDVFDAQYCVKHTGRFEATSLDCYQCTSQEELICGDDKLVISSLIPANCSYVYDARYCIKSIGQYGGGIGTKRFCSALDLGNYCHYVTQQGDKLTYRTCIYTCTGDGCNPATSFKPTIAWTIPIGLLIAYKLLFQR